VTHLLFLHGLGGGHHAWDRQLPHFAALGYPSHAWDQPGYGHTPLVEPYDLEQVSAAAKRLIDSFREPMVLVGHSMGGFIAQETYARHPASIKALVLSFTSPGFGDRGGDFARQFIAARVGALDQGKTMPELAAELMPTMRGRKSDPAGLKHAQGIMSGIAPETYRKAVQLLTTFDGRHNLKNIKVPTLCIAGSEDKTAPPKVVERMAKEIPGAELEILDGCGHLGPMDQPDAFNAVLEKFLKRHAL
jgi:3-oxoadipate enol-lactonase